MRSNTIGVGTTPDIRKSKLRRLLETGKFLKFIEVHSPISAIIAENTIINKKIKNFSMMVFGQVL